MALSTKPVRTDLTDRECTSILGATIGGLMEMAPRENIEAAIQWWFDHRKDGLDLLEEAKRLR
jgi:hypothetical protein